VRTPQKPAYEAYTEHDDLLDEALRCDPAVGGYDRRDEPPCELCGQPTTQTILTRYGGLRTLCAMCWDPVVHGEPPAAKPDSPASGTAS
jgi:hypothetical protein